MKEKTKEPLHCPYCDFRSKQKAKMLKHIHFCQYNPENIRPCLSCNNNTPKMVAANVVLCIAGNRMTIKHNVELPYCTKNKIFIHTPIDAKKANIYKIEGEQNNEMPTKCRKYKLVDNTQI